MDYQQFLRNVLDGLMNIYPEHDISLHSVKKNNGIVLDGICIKDRDSNIAPTLYMESFYTMIKSGYCIDEVIKRICSVYESHNDVNLSLDEIADISDFSIVSKNIYYVVVNYEKNKELLANCPHRRVHDLAIVYRINIYVGDGLGSVLIKNEMADNIWHVDEKYLYETAVKNTSTLFCPMVQSMNEVLVEIMHGKDDYNQEILDSVCNLDLERHMLVVSNNARTAGAGVIFIDEDIQKRVSEVMGGDYIIIPSSVHETIITDLGEADTIKDMVVEVNKTQVSTEDFLSNNIYIYRSDEKRIQIVI